jgi:hypothetical protein
MKYFPSSIVFFAMSEFDWPIAPKKNEIMEAPQDRKFYFEVWKSSPLPHLYRVE